MRICLTLLLIVVNTFVLAQFSDDFEDGDFSTAPTWTGQTANFIVNGNNELQLNAPAVSDTSYLSLPTTNIDNTTWTFYLRMEFNPSSTNFARVYLVADNANLKGSLNGYFVMLGGTPDEISLYRQDGIAITKIIDGTDGSLNSDPCEARVEVTRDGTGNWELLRDTTGGYNYISEGIVLDATHTVNTNAGIFCKYTSTRSDKFFLDDFGDPYMDVIAPFIDTVVVNSLTEVDLHFNEPVTLSSAESSGNYQVNSGLVVPQTILRDAVDSSIVHLTFNPALFNDSIYDIQYLNIDDFSPFSGQGSGTDTFYVLVPDTALYNDVIITEVFADPTPSVGLPEVEYVEIYNRSSKTFDLSGWTLWDAASSGTFGSYILTPGAYLLICGTGNCGQFFVPNATELALPSLNNSDDAVVIKDNFGNMIDSIYFNLSWYADGGKEDGGWSIERKHNDAPCNDATNWGASVDPFGGTPALQNSIWTDQDDMIAPALSALNVLSDTEVLLTFDELIDTTTTLAGSVVPTLPWTVNGWLDQYTVSLNFQSLQVNTIYEFSFTGLSDCWGNVSSGLAIFGIPDSAVSEDLILNEIMFDPLTNGSDYVEIYNRSQKILDLQELFLANWDEAIASYSPITNYQRLIMPGEYVLITEDTSDIINDFSIYGSGTFIQTDIPTYPNDSGTVYLLTKDSLILDYFHYDEDFHFALISDPDGKSLERISFDAEQNDPDNWHTAAEYVEWGTPGYQNSQLFIAQPNGNVSVDPSIFSPDNDGYQDIVTINLDLQTTENVIDIEIFDSHGRRIRLLKDNFFVGNSASFTWDGISDSGEKASIGTYIILVSIVDENGEQQQYKLVAVLAGKF